jgi:two-component system sensor kinase FixL
VSNSLSLLVAFEALQLVLIVALATHSHYGRRDRALLVRQRAGSDERTAALVHELNQPLTAILSNAQAAKRFLATDQLDVRELQEILDDIVTDDKRAAGIVKRVGAILQDGGASSQPKHIPDQSSSGTRERMP